MPDWKQHQDHLNAATKPTNKITLRPFPPRHDGDQWMVWASWGTHGTPGVGATEEEAKRNALEQAERMIAAYAG